MLTLLGTEEGVQVAMRRKQQSEQRAGFSEHRQNQISRFDSPNHEMCRLCGVENHNYLDIFGDHGIKRNLPFLVKNYLSITVFEDDKFSRLMCTKCCCHLETFHQFFKCVKEVQRKLDEQKCCINDFSAPKIETRVSGSDQDERVDNSVEAKHLGPINMQERDAIALGILNNISIDSSSDEYDEADGPVKIKVEGKESEEECDDDQANTTSEDEDADGTSTSKRPEFKEQERDLAEFFKIVCHECGTKFHSLSLLTTHCKKAHDSIPKIYCHCGKSFERRTHLIRHRNQHLGVHRYKCEMCQRGFHYKFMLRSHMYTHGPDSDKPFECDECRKRYITKSALVSHKVSKHAPPKARVTCEICGNTFSHPNCLYTHKRTVHGDQRHFVCHVCGKTMSTLGNLKGHLETHKESCNIQCEFCGKRFKTRMRLVRHMEYHNAVVHECSICRKKYQTRGSLRAHLLVHSDQRPHKCNLCEKSFKRSKQLKLHVYQHTGERPYKCPFCPKTFTNAGNRATHKRRMHAKETHQGQAAEGGTDVILQENETAMINMGDQGHLQTMTAALNHPSMVMGGLLIPANLQAPCLDPSDLLVHALEAQNYCPTI
ncbi:zinc finger protein 660-like isoform X1 [Cloeon dipterum]|uniref:zinc finger protein 660-like isoform X1 n=2 Tax=Cloeon dipterum TaxID=197152 RepID=UPI00321FB8B3